MPIVQSGGDKARENEDIGETNYHERQRIPKRTAWVPAVLCASNGRRYSQHGHNRGKDCARDTELAVHTYPASRDQKILSKEEQHPGAEHERVRADQWTQG